ncbi:LIC_13387 family protein [Niabella sp. 22666]|uniref:LIC_13387 family protein n=1 Tax=Niabella sp. 22666 TaxID=3453954 RepID=UPI003F83803B
MKNNLARTVIIVASAVLLFFGLLHLHGTFYSTDLHPEDVNVLYALQSTHIKMDETGNFWNLWLGFNAMFSMGLIFIGAINLYFSARQFKTLLSNQFVLLLTIISNSFLVWIGNQYMIAAFTLGMIIPLLLYLTGFLLIRFKYYNSGQNI